MFTPVFYNHNFKINANVDIFLIHHRPYNLELKFLDVEVAYRISNLSFQ